MAERVAGVHIYPRMNKFIGYLVALAALIASLEAVSPEAEPAEPDCPAGTPCADRQLVALPPDSHEGESDAVPPASELQRAVGPTGSDRGPTGPLTGAAAFGGTRPFGPTGLSGAAALGGTRPFGPAGPFAAHGLIALN